MKQAYEARALVRSTPKGFTIWISQTSFDTAEKMPEEEARPSDALTETNTTKGA